MQSQYKFQALASARCVQVRVDAFKNQGEEYKGGKCIYYYIMKKNVQVEL